jgi:H+/Cl- antiporter ClcA
VLLVMAAYLSGVTRAPVTSFIIMMEMTDSHQMLLPLMTASVVANAISKHICPTPLYHKLSERFSLLPARFSATAIPPSESIIEPALSGPSQTTPPPNSTLEK